MLGQDKNRSGRSSSFVLDMIHIVTGILIVAFAVLAFLNPEENMILFPVIFLLAGVLNLVNGADRFCSGRGQRKKRASGMALMAVGVLLLALCAVSAVTIWWG